MTLEPSILTPASSLYKKNGRRFFASYPSHTIVPMPSLSPTMETGVVANWLLKEGDKFEAGTAICEVETDKATVTYDATEEGYIAKILVGTGEVTVGVPMMITVDEQADVAAFSAYVIVDSPSDEVPVPPAASAPVTPPPAPVATVSAPAAVMETAATSSSQPSGARVMASPLARKLLRDAGLLPSSLEGINASGPGGRVISADVLAMIAKGVQPKIAAISPPVTTTAAPSVSHPPAPSRAPLVSAVPGVYQDFELSNLALSVANRHTAAKQQVPHYYLSVELNLTKLLALREELNASTASSKKGPVEGLSVLDFIVKASALAVNQVPDVNGAWMDTFVRRYDQVDINLIMGTGQGLLTPLVRDAGSKGLKGISQEIGGFEDSLFAEDNSVDASKMAIGTFSIHNLGMYGVKSASPIVLAPQACALALGAIIDSVVPRVEKKEGDEEW
eukprot:CAMPEP_0119033990 /NCGR_PEP_ID=MMETSP1177-20130426/1057_1 /TAXON_ID=2985 /ORGANISM="Ochromonas sp, Strain CCMP1899" /LENGTH=447 /DNA_ID=CAMNT_0006991157 /DNA_START=280 /DNA_END=1620 /DNA_ORIENTATION=+